MKPIKAEMLQEIRCIEINVVALLLMAEIVRF